MWHLKKSEVKFLPRLIYIDNNPELLCVCVCVCVCVISMTVLYLSLTG